MADAISYVGPRSDEDAQRAIFKIMTKHPGTGFLFYDNRHILTAQHVIKDAEQVKVKVCDVSNAETPQEYLASVQKFWKNWDIALLYLDEPIQNVRPFNLLPQTLSHPTQIRTYGFPGSFGKSWHSAEITGGPVDGKYDIDLKTNYPDKLGGLSGGPIFLSGDKNYDIVGIITNHGPDNLQKGKIVPAKAFLEEIEKILKEEKEKTAVWCYVVLSGADVENIAYTLEEAVKSALRNDSQVRDGTKPLEFKVASDLVKTPEDYKEAVKKICQTKIAIFDITHFEPAVMLLLGVRSVVRRGVTIASTGDYVIGDAFDIPFNIKELTIASHSKEQYDKTKKPPYLIIRDKIKEGLRQLEKLPQYLDLPAFDAVRNLPSGYREPDPDSVLILCPYSTQYQDTNWKQLENFLSPCLYKEETSNTSEQEANQGDPKIMRILDLLSPRLVSSTIYEAIRRKDLCLVDWTEWRPNVFFEFGVRLAVTGTEGFTVCVIEDRYKYLTQEIKKLTSSNEDICWLVRVDSKDPKKIEEINKRYKPITEQCQLLLALFNPLVYNVPSPKQEQDSMPEHLKKSFQFDRSVYDHMMHYYKYKDKSSISSTQKYGRTPNFTHEFIELYIDIEQEPVSVPVYIDLLRTAELFDVEGNKNQTVVLYPKNENLNLRVEKGIIERLLAAWYYLRQEYPDEKEIISDDNLFKAYRQIGLRLHKHIQDTRPRMADEINDILEALEAFFQKKGDTHE
jgi:Trypsin-like peptidase domain